MNWRKLFTEEQRLVAEQLEGLKSNHGGWRKSTVMALGLEFPPPKNWRLQLILKGEPLPGCPLPDVDEPEVEEKPFVQWPEWLRLRYQILKRSRGHCELCGAHAGHNETVLAVDHIKPRSLYPELALDPDNLQVLCEECNTGKSNTDETDWR